MILSGSRRQPWTLRSRRLHKRSDRPDPGAVHNVSSRICRYASRQPRSEFGVLLTEHRSLEMFRGALTPAPKSPPGTAGSRLWITRRTIPADPSGNARAGRLWARSTAAPRPIGWAPRGPRYSSRAATSTAVTTRPGSRFPSATRADRSRSRRCATRRARRAIRAPTEICYARSRRRP